VFHPEVIARAEHAVSRQLAATLPGGRLVRRSLDERWTMRDQLASAAPKKKGEPASRALTSAESDFITHELLLAKLDYRYWSDAWAVITKETQDAAPIHPRWASQQLFLDHVAAMEIDQFRAGSQNGVLVNVGKARQLGLSTELEVIMAHGATTQTALRGLVAADVEDQSKYLFSLFEGIVKELPWWLLPTLGAYDTGRFWSTLTNRTEVRTAWGKSSRGGLADDAKAKGNIGRGKTFGRVHLSELSTWEKPDQIDDGLIPAIPRRPRSFAGFESTAKGRHDWWHTHWTATARGKTRFRNIFIPWYVEPEKYWAVPTSLTWQPDAGTLAHAVAVERESPEWLFGKTIRLTREQLAWYEQTRDMYTEKGDLYKFYEEYPATPAEMFQYSGRSVFTAATLEAVRRQETAPRILKIEPAKDIATLRAWERSEEGRSGAPRPDTRP
jgi:hypothetical protein